mgnify:FL=1
MDIVLGQVVYSKAGRDEGRVFIITGIIDDKYVYICDGQLRRIENPKKKKIKHLDITDLNIEYLAQKLNSGIKISNAEIRKALAGLKSGNEINEEAE